MADHGVDRRGRDVHAAIRLLDRGAEGLVSRAITGDRRGEVLSAGVWFGVRRAECVPGACHHGGGGLEGLCAAGRRDARGGEGLRRVDGGVQMEFRTRWRGKGLARERRKGFRRMLLGERSWGQGARSKVAIEHLEPPQPFFVLLGKPVDARAFNLHACHHIVNSNSVSRRRCRDRSADTHRGS